MPQGVQISDSSPAGAGAAYLNIPGPYNPVAVLSPTVVKKILALEFVEMLELRADVWPEYPVLLDTTIPPHCTAQPPVIKTWLECYARTAAVLVPCFPEKGPELWVYQSTILNAAHSSKDPPGWPTTGCIVEKCWHARPSTGQCQTLASTMRLSRAGLE